jgi:hypothetical protein
MDLIIQDFSNTIIPALSLQKNNSKSPQLKKMRNKILILTASVAILIIYLSSCYNNKQDITTLPRVSFVGEVVPIITSDGCGCHSNSNANSANRNAIAFINFDTTWSYLPDTTYTINREVNYNAIIARVDTFRLWASGAIGHPGGGMVDFTPLQKEVISKWVAQGPPYDGGGISCIIPSNPTYTNAIVPIYQTTCKSAGCHEGRGPQLSYSILVSMKPTLITMMNSGGATGHPGGTIGLSSCITKTFLAWIAASQPQ